MNEEILSKDDMLSAMQQASEEAQTPVLEQMEEETQDGRENMELIMDVPMCVSVELGKTKKTIREILSFGMGTVIPLEKTAGAAVDILVNGKFIGKGEVVVIDDSYGVRITEVNVPSTQEV